MAAIRFEGVSKRFELTHAKRRSIVDLLVAAFGRAGQEVEEFWALRDVSFEVERGQTLGIIGPNGSGKTTILKLLSGTLFPDGGVIETDGKVFGLLELGAGFHPDLTGRENIFLNGSFLGIHRRDMARLYRQIVEFAELARFIDTPIKHYSSGMYMRLGFSIAIAVEPDILLIDEVLAVGDAAFARKCYEALAGVKKAGRTMLFVSHDPIQVRRFCDRVIWIEDGRIKRLGHARDVVQEYVQASAGPATFSGAAARTEPSETGSGPVVIEDVSLLDDDGSPSHSTLPGGTVVVRIAYRSRSYLDDVVFGCSIRRSDGLYMHDSSSATSHGPVSVHPGAGMMEHRLGPLPLGPGAYNLSVASWPASNRLEPHHVLRNCATLFVGRARAAHRGVAVIPNTWRFGSAEQPTREAEKPPIKQPDMLTPELLVAWSSPPERLSMGESEEEFLGEGWHPVEDWPPAVRWMGRKATAFLTQDVARGTLVISACRPFHSESSATGTVRINGAEVTRFRVSGMDFEDIVIPLDPVISPARLQVELELEETFVPAVVGIDPDTRELGLAVREIRIE